MNYVERLINANNAILLSLIFRLILGENL